MKEMKSQNSQLFLQKIFSAFNKFTFAYPGDSGFVFVVKKSLQKLKFFLSKYYDPLVLYRLNDRIIEIPLSHRFPNFCSEWPLYDSALTRLSDYVRTLKGNIKLIDIGANVGETLNLIIKNEFTNDSYLCVEPQERFFQLLKKNTRSYNNVYLSNKLLGEKNILIKGRIVSSGGTANIEKTSEEIAETTTLDTLIQGEFKDFLNSDIIKIDTDGYDYKIIRGAYNILRQKSPILFFELAPEELINNGNENPLDIFPIFNELDYHYFICYDNNGFLLTSFEISQDNVIEGVINYAKNKWSTWLDVIAFPANQKVYFDEFYLREKLYINKFSKSIPRNRHF